MSPVLDAADLDSAARALNLARAQRAPIQPFTDEAPSLSVADAYAIADRIIAMRTRGGARLVGHKIGLTSAAVQQQLGVDQPDFGALLDVMEISDGATIDAFDYIAPRVEVEVAFRLGGRLEGPGVTVADVRRATESVRPAIELVDSRIVDWRIRLADTVADNASSAGFVLGGAQRAIDDLDITAVEVELHRDGDPVERGSSSAVLGDPCAAVAWLANALAEHGVALEAGQVVLSGACTRMVPATPGTAFRGMCAGLGDVSLTIRQAG